MIHFVAYNEVHHEDIEEPLSDEQKKELMYRIVHDGNTRSVESMSLNQQFLAGATQFDQVFDKEVVRITDDGASKTKEILVLKDVLHRQQGVRFVVGQEITEKLIRSSTLKGTRVVESRTMKKNAEVALKNARKCIVYAKQWMKGKSKLPRGKTWTDLYNHVHQQMVEHLQGPGEDDIDGKEVVAIDESAQIQNGLFPGWMVFVLFGPYGPEPRSEIELLLEVEAPVTRNVVAQNASTTAPNRSRASKQSGHQLSFHERAIAAVVAQRHDSHKLRIYEFEIGFRQTQVANLLTQQRLHLQFMEMADKVKRKALDPE